MIETIKDIAGFIGIMCAFGISILWAFIISVARFSGEWGVWLDFNKYGEGLAEWYMTPVILILIIWGIYHYFIEAFVRE